jgi:hypothetical protein
MVTVHDAVVHFIADLTDGCSAIAACCLTPRGSVSLSRKFRAGIVPDARLFPLQSVGLLCRKNSTREFGPGDNLSCAAFTLDIK